MLALLLPADHELFAVAPMMAHTNRHWHSFFRLLSRRAHLYTEMVPASQLVAASRMVDEADFRRAFEPHDAETEYVLQLGGHDRDTLAEAARLGVQLGYRTINLNCGCPSVAVSGGARGGGAALMREPAHVADCCTAMLEAMSLGTPSPTALTVKHRLGVADAATFDAAADRAAGDGPAFESASKFINAIAATGVSRLQVHARLALLGEFGNNAAAGLDKAPQLWVPGAEDNSAQEKVDHSREQHKAKLRARKATIANRNVPPLRHSVVRAIAAAYPELQATAKPSHTAYTHLPPLAVDHRHLVPSSFASCQIVANGELNSLAAVRDERVLHGVHGGMVGRSVINHPCAFAAADSLWGETIRHPLTRGEVLECYATYCDSVEEEAAAAPSLLTPPSAKLQSELVAPVFNLFAGVPGSERYQRRLRAIYKRAKGWRFASSLLRVAAAELPAEALDMVVTDAVPVSELVTYERATRVAGPLQRHIH